jgi:hypothetical protein
MATLNATLPLRAWFGVGGDWRGPEMERHDIYCIKDRMSRWHAQRGLDDVHMQGGRHAWHRGGILTTYLTGFML